MGKVIGSSSNGNLWVIILMEPLITATMIDTSGQSDTEKENPLSTDQIKEVSNFKNWDFDSVWIMTNDKPVRRYFYCGPTLISYECISGIKPEIMNIEETSSIQAKIEPLGDYEKSTRKSRKVYVFNRN